MLRLARPAMGSLFEIVAVEDGLPAPESLLYSALDRVDWLEKQLSHYDPGSDICQINAHAYDAPVPVAGNLFALLLRLRSLSLATEGAFDCTAGKLLKAWGLLRRGADKIALDAAPAEAELREIVRHIGWRNVELDEAEQTIRFLTPHVQLHLGAAGKGFAVQAVADYLRSEGVAAALIHSGFSSIAALGAPPDSDGWPVKLPEGAAGAPTIMLRDASLSTSGPNELPIRVKEKRLSHLLDPRTGQLVAPGATVSVLAPDALEGDALSTAFALQGPEWTARFCAEHPAYAARFASPDRPDQVVGELA